MTDPRRDVELHHADTSRLEAFSDGVFAIAITLLVIEVSVPHVDEGSLAQALRDQWPSYAGYALSFVIIGIMWMNHHAMFRDIERIDHGVNVLNLLLLMCISFVPFTTAVLADYMTDEQHQLTAVLAYGANFTITAIAFNGLWLYVTRRPEFIDEHVSVARIRARTLRYLPGPFLYAAGILLAFISTWLSLALWAGLAVLYLLPPPD